MVLQLIVPPVSEPVTSTELREFLRLQPLEEEPLLQHLIRVAREVIEQWCNLAMLKQSWQLQLDNWPQSGRVALYKAPVLTIDHVQGWDAQQQPVHFTADQWRLDVQSRPQRLYLSRPPAVTIAHGVMIELTAGLATIAGELPQPLCHATMMLAAHLYENRNVAAPDTQQLPPLIEQLLAPWHRRGRL